MRPGPAPRAGLPIGQVRSPVGQVGSLAARGGSHVGRTDRPEPRNHLSPDRRRYVLLLVALAVSALAAAQTVSRFTVKRDDTELVISNMALAADGARSIGNNANCEDDQRLTIVYGPAPGHVETRVEDAVITSSLAVVSTPVDAEDGEGQDTLELSDVAVTFNRPGCIEEAVPAGDPAVTLVQGRTTVVGTRFFLDRNEDVGTMDGPIALTRSAETDGDEPLTATSNAMTFAVNEQRATLTGEVQVTSEERVTTGETLVLDEEAGTAVLTGSPARSVRGEDVLEGSRLLYYLNSDDVVVLGNVSGELDVELE